MNQSGGSLESLRVLLSAYACYYLELQLGTRHPNFVLKHVSQLFGLVYRFERLQNITDDNLLINKFLELLLTHNNIDIPMNMQNVSLENPNLKIISETRKDFDIFKEFFNILKYGYVFLMEHLILG